MRIICYFLNWNDSYYIPFLHRHYSQFCEKLIMYDQYSTDGSVELAKSLGIEVRDFGRIGVLDDQTYLNVKCHVWKECRDKGIDYVIVVDADEFIVLPHGPICASLPTMLGFNMISNELPDPAAPGTSIFDVRTGSVDMNYAKHAIFCPNRIQEINYVHGCHRANPVGEITTGDECKLYHYRMLGGVDRMIERHEIYNQRMSAFNRKHGMGVHYTHSAGAKRVEWAYLEGKAVCLW